MYMKHIYIYTWYIILIHIHLTIIIAVIIVMSPHEPDVTSQRNFWIARDLLGMEHVKENRTGIVRPTNVWHIALYSAKSLQSCPTLCDPTNCSLPGSSVSGIFQARVLEWVAISFSRGSSWPRDRTQVSYVSCIADKFFTTSNTLEASTHSTATSQPCTLRNLFKLSEPQLLHQHNQNAYFYIFVED